MLYKITEFLVLLGALSMANPKQLYEKVSEVEALSRNDGQIFDKDWQEEAFSRNPRHRPRRSKRDFYTVDIS